MILTPNTNPRPTTPRNPRISRKPDLFGGTLFSAGLAAAAISVPTFADIINVPGEQPTIAAAMAIAQNGDQIVLAPGIYNYGNDGETTPGTPTNAAIFESRGDGKSITLRSTDPNDPAVVAATVLNGYDDYVGASYAYGLQFGLGYGDVLSGLTMTGFNEFSYIEDHFIAMELGASLINCNFTDVSTEQWVVDVNAAFGLTTTIKGCAFSGDTLRHIGASGSGVLIIEDCSFADAGRGSVIVDGCALKMNNCDFDANVPFFTPPGDPLSFPGGGVLKIVNLADTSFQVNAFTNLVIRNTRVDLSAVADADVFQRGLAIDIEPTVAGLSDSIVFVNCTIVGTDRFGGAAGLDAFGAANGGKFVNCIVRRNRDNFADIGTGILATFDLVNGGPVLRSNVDDAVPEDSGLNIDADPLFADAPFDPFSGTDFVDVRLTTGSPSIDAGDASFGIVLTFPDPFLTDLDGNQRIFDDPGSPNTGAGADGWIDHGAYEFAAPVFVVAAGACCLEGACLVMTSADCAATGGTYFGNGVTCGEVVCEQPTGACCINGACVVLSSADCIAAGGTYQGDGIDCSGVVCPEACPADISGDTNVNVTDLLLLLGAWGACP